MGIRIVLRNTKAYLIALRTGYPPRDENEILDQIDSKPISPEALLYQNVRLPGLANSLTHNNLVIVAIGKNRHDDLKVRNHGERMRLSLSIPADKFDSLN